MGGGGGGVASEFSSIEKISRWHKLEKRRSGYGYGKKCVDIIPLFSVSEQADDFYHAANNLLLLLVAYSHITCVCNNNLHYGAKVHIQMYINIYTLNVFACNREWKIVANIFQ